MTNVTIDVEARIVAARDDIQTVHRRLPELWEHRYAPDTTPRKQAEQERRGKSNVEGFAAWTGPTQIQRVYQAVTAAVARAHRELGQSTDVPEYWLRSQVDARPLVGELAPTEPLDSLQAWCAVLDANYGWLQERFADLAHPELSAIVRACNYTHTARNHIDKLWPKIVQPVANLCENPSCPNQRGKDRKKCGTCSNFESQHGKPRIVNSAGRAT